MLACFSFMPQASIWGSCRHAEHYLGLVLAYCYCTEHSSVHAASMQHLAACWQHRDQSTAVSPWQYVSLRAVSTLHHGHLHHLPRTHISSAWHACQHQQWAWQPVAAGHALQGNLQGASATGWPHHLVAGGCAEPLGCQRMWQRLCDSRWLTARRSAAATLPIGCSMQRV
jgi:hypothetical protein